MARALFSPGSAEDRSSLFAWFIDSMARSDSSRACVSAVWPWAFAGRPRSLVGGEALQRSLGSRACCFSACAGSSTTQDRLLARVYRETAVLPSSNQERVGVLVLRFSKLNSPAHRYPCLRFKRHLAMPPARLRAKMESLLLSCRTLSFPATCRFSPAHPD